MKKSNFKLKKMWGLNRTYKEALSIAIEKNNKILDKAEIGQEIIMDGKFIKYFGGRIQNIKDKTLHKTKKHAWFLNHATNVIKLGAKHPEFAEKLKKEETFEFEEDKYIYAGNCVCYYTGKNYGRRRCHPHYNYIDVWVPFF